MNTRPHDASAIVSRLRDSAQLSTLPNWARREFEQAADLIEAAYLDPAPGFVLAPVEPTPEMLRAGFLSGSNGFEISQPADAPGLVYKAMLAVLLGRNMGKNMG